MRSGSARGPDGALGRGAPTRPGLVAAFPFWARALRWGNYGLEARVLDAKRAEKEGLVVGKWTAMVLLSIISLGVPSGIAGATGTSLAEWAQDYGAHLSALTVRSIAFATEPDAGTCTALAKEALRDRSVPGPPMARITWTAAIKHLAALAQGCRSGNPTRAQARAGGKEVGEVVSFLANHHVALGTRLLGRIKALAAAPNATTTTTSSTTTTTTAPAPKVLFTQAGSGDQTTVTFTAPTTWTLAWSYDCSALGQAGIFQVWVDGPTPGADGPIGELGTGSSGVQHYHAGGSVYLQINSECSWKVTATSAE